MLRFIGAAAVLALAAANPAFAQGRGNAGGAQEGRGAEHASFGQGPGKDRGPKSDAGKPPQREVARNAVGQPVIERVDRGPGERIREVRDLRDERSNDRVRSVERAVQREIDRDDDWRRRGGWDSDGDWDGRDRIFASVPGCPPGLAKKNKGCLPPGLARKDRDAYFDYDYRPTLFAIPLRTRADYVYYDGYLIPAGGAGLPYIPLLGGALAVGQVWPQAYPSLQLAEWQRDYFGLDDPRGYRYADNVVYRIDPETAAIMSVAALLTGNDFVVGRPMPVGYDVYNVPAAYQDRYVDSDEALYRYADGRIYQVDPATMLIAQAIDLVV
jgi:hypothetical protein